jgi:transposase
LLDRVQPRIGEVTTAIEHEAERRPEARRLMTHSGVGPLAELAFWLIVGPVERFGCSKQSKSAVI